MQFKKIAAITGTALMTGLAIAGPALASSVTAINSISDLVSVTDSTVSFPIFVVGATAKTADVAGAVGVAVALASEAKTTTAVEVTGEAVDGVLKDTVGIGTSSGGNALSNDMPANGVLKTFHYTGLKDGVISWKSADYDYREEVDISRPLMRHSLTLSGVNGTEKLQISSSKYIKYRYVFEKAINLSSATSAGTTGTLTSPEYTYPINIELLGKKFVIVGISSSQIKALSGSIGTADATTPVTYETYSVYATQGSNAAWAKIVIKDADGNTVDTMIIDQNNSKDSSATGLTVKVTSVRALTDGTVVGVDLVVGPTGTTEKNYDATADVTSTGTASDRFPGETEWGIQFSASGCSDGYMGANSAIEVIYKPSATQYLIAGEKVSLPNDYGELGFLGWNTNKFATITVKPLDSTVSAYNYSDDAQPFSELTGFEITSDVTGSIGTPKNNWFDKAYILFNKSFTSGTETAHPVMIGFYDTSKQKIRVNGTFVAINKSTSGEYASKYIGSLLATDNVTYGFELKYGSVGEQSYWLNVSIGAQTPIADQIKAGKSSLTIVMDFKNKSSWTSEEGPTFALGTEGTAQVNDVNVTTEGTGSQGAGKKAQEIVDDSGILLQDPESNAGSDKVVFKIPSKDLKAKVYFGKITGAATTGTSEQVLKVTSDIVKLDSEITDTDKTSNDLILVGGPCVNTLVASLATDGKFPYTCDTWPARNFGRIQLISGAFADGYTALVIAGTRAEDTDLAARIVQTETGLSDKTGSAVEVTSFSAAGVTAV